MIGGFLGAGKTTTIGRLASYYQSLGKRVGIVTNDQATDLVDTHLLRSQGFDVGEVAGSCFCCNFNELTKTVEGLGVHERPDVILAEPVGSCTDLVATVIRPLQQVYAQPIEIAPYGVIIKPSHGLKILKNVSKGGFSPQAAYIFRKQIEEADFVILNRIDELSSEAVAELTSLIESQYPGRECVCMSAVTGQGFDVFCDILDRAQAVGTKSMDVDYDVYAEGEAELGWLNAQLEVTSTSPIDLDYFLLQLLHHIREAVRARDAEVAHLKVIGMADGHYAVANLISNESESKLSISSSCRTSSADVVVNARIAIDPESLTQFTQQAIEKCCMSMKVQATIRTLQSFRPGRPVPTHRLEKNLSQ
jgi:G3E family GTPase